MQRGIERRLEKVSTVLVRQVLVLVVTTVASSAVTRWQKRQRRTAKLSRRT